MKDELNTLRRTVALERSRRAELANAIEDVERREALARSRLTQLKEQVSDELAALESARWELLLSDLQNAWIIRSTSQELLQDWDSRQSLEEYLLERRENWPNPYETILDSIERIQKRNRADDRLPTGYFRETRKFVERNRNYLVCEKPDIDSLLETLRHEQQKIDHIAERKTEKSIQEIVARYEDRGQEVKITDEFRERQKRIHRVGEKHRIERRFRDVIDGYLYQCRAAIRNIMRQLTREKDVRL